MSWPRVHPVRLRLSVHVSAWRLLLATLLVLTARAADTPRYSARRYTTDDGLPQTRVSCLAQTPDGYLWCGTWFGLARFDGVRFVTFDRHNTPALAASDAIQSLAVDGHGRLWAGTAKALVRQAAQGFVEVPLAGGWGGLGVSGLWPKPGGGVWAAGERGLAAADGTNAVLSPHPAGAFGVPRVAASAAGSGQFLVQAAHGGFEAWRREATGGPWQMFPRLQKPAEGWDRDFAGVAGSAPDGLWVYWAGGLMRLSVSGEFRSEILPDEVHRAGIRLAAPAQPHGRTQAAIPRYK